MVFHPSAGRPSPAGPSVPPWMVGRGREQGPHRSGHNVCSRWLGDNGCAGWRCSGSSCEIEHGVWVWKCEVASLRSLRSMPAGTYPSMSVHYCCGYWFEAFKTSRFFRTNRVLGWSGPNIVSRIFNARSECIRASSSSPNALSTTLRLLRSVATSG